MTVEELLEILQEYAETEPDMEVRLAHQPSWPFEYSIGAIEEVTLDDDTRVLYIAESQQLGYLPAEASASLGW